MLICDLMGRPVNLARGHRVGREGHYGALVAAPQLKGPPESRAKLASKHCLIASSGAFGLQLFIVSVQRRFFCLCQTGRMSPELV